MPSDSGERRATRPHQGGAPPPEPEHLACPRCDSTNTKFCYYNNYNFSQPRHFCKSCRRYWTHGGTLRDIPVGGGSRKNAKRSRTTIPAATSSSVSAPATQDHPHVFVPTGTPVLLPFSVADHCGSIPFVGDAKPGLNVCGGFTSFLSNPAPGPGFLAVGGFGLGLGPGFEDMGFGLGRAVWPFQGVGDGGAGSGGGGSGGGGGASMIGNTWQLESGEDGCINGDCFSLPDLAISTPAGNGLK